MHLTIIIWKTVRLDNSGEDSYDGGYFKYFHIKNIENPLPFSVRNIRMKAGVISILSRIIKKTIFSTRNLQDKARGYSQASLVGIFSFPNEKDSPKITDLLKRIAFIVIIKRIIILNNFCLLFLVGEFLILSMWGISTVKYTLSKIT